ncbi:hypothetical protein ACQ4PT_055608 [Festuca glaucescens]
MRRLFAAAWPHLLISLLLVALQSKAVSSSGATAGRPEWQVLTRTNFSSQIRLHPHVLLVVTMPWYGESRSLMAEIEHLVSTDKQELGLLKLMVVYRNSEKLLSDAIGASEGTKFMYYRQSIPFKYQGKLRSRDILYSVRYTMSLKHEEAPFVPLHTKQEVEAFIQSTDKAVLLSEFCGWFTRLASGGSNTSSGATPSKTHTDNVDISAKTLTRESDGRLELVVEDEELSFGGGGQLTGSTWKGGFTIANQSVSDQIKIPTDENRKLCTVQKFQQFESFYARLTSLSREYFLPPEIVRFGLITDKSSLPSPDVINESNSETWFLSVHYVGCTTCSVIAKEGDDLRRLLQSHHNLDVKEIDADESGAEATFPANRPSAILFVDRLSDSLKTRDESKLSLKILREYVQKNYPPYVVSGDLNNGNSKMVPSVLSTTRGAPDARSGTVRLHALTSKYMELGDKISVMVVKDGESISYEGASQDSTSSPLYDILTKLIHKTRSAHSSKKTRISFVAKDVGIKLLSDESEVKVGDFVSIRESQHDRIDDLFASSDSVNDGIAEVVHENKATEEEYIDDGQSPTITEKTPAYYCGIDCSDTGMKEQQEAEAEEASDVSLDLHEEVSIDVHSSNEVPGMLQKHTDEKTVSEGLDILEPDRRNVHSNNEKSGSPNQQDDVFSFSSHESERIEGFIGEDDVFSLDDEKEKSDSKYSPHETFSSSSILGSDNTEYAEQVTSSISDNRFVGSFFFSDGGYRLLRTLTGGSRIPSLVIIDPVQQKHYVFPQENEFSYPSLANYFDSFVNQSLFPYYRSASPVVGSKELPRPPFVNQDFHEANSIPLLTASTFCPLVFGFEGCESKYETSFLNAENIASAWKKDVLVLFSNSWCGFCQRTDLVVRELHRSFKSFLSLNSQVANAQDLQTKEKNGESTSEGLPTIYMMDCTANECHQLLKLAGKEEFYPTVLLFPAENKSAISFEGGVSVGNLIEFLESHVTNSRHIFEYKGYLRKKRMVMQHDAPQTIQFHINDDKSSSVGSYPPSDSEKRKVHIVTGSILGATEKLGGTVPFDNARVLIVSADPHEGFYGLIINKRLSWDAFKNLDSSMEPIKLAPLFYGGPVVVQGYHLVSLSRVALEGYTQVVPNLYYGNIIATSRVITAIKAGGQSAEDLWFFVGYAGWGYSQLFDELSEGAWHISGEPMERLDWPDS